MSSEMRELIRKEVEQWVGITRNRDIERSARVWMEGYDAALTYCAERISALLTRTEAAPVADGAVAWMTADGKLCTARERRDCLVQDASTYTIPLTHPHDAIAREAVKSAAALLRQMLDSYDEPPSLLLVQATRIWLNEFAALPSPPKEKE